MKDFIKGNSVFLVLFAIVFTGIGIALLTIDKADLHLWLNSYHTSIGDWFFRHYTRVPEYAVYIIALFMLFWKAGASIYLLSAEALGGIVVQIVKHIVRAPRPSVFFDLKNHPDALPVVDGVRLHSSNSFPSGHTNTFFILFFVVSIVVWYYLWYERKHDSNHSTQQVDKQGLCYSIILQVICFILAIMGAYSRIYLSQHFAADIFAGGIIGIASVLILYPFFAWLNKKYPKVCTYHISLPKRKSK